MFEHKLILSKIATKSNHNGKIQKEIIMILVSLSFYGHRIGFGALDRNLIDSRPPKQSEFKWIRMGRIA